MQGNIPAIYRLVQNMNAKSMNGYFRPYGRLGTNRMANLRSFLVRVRSPFDSVDDPRRDQALRETLGQHDLQNLTCVFCGEPAKEWDHLHKAADGGPHQIGNLVPACVACNRRRGPWELHLDRLAVVDGQDRKSRIAAYQRLLKSPGEKLEFTPDELEALRTGVISLESAITEIDKAIDAATDRYKQARAQARVGQWNGLLPPQRHQSARLEVSEKLSSQTKEGVRDEDDSNWDGYCKEHVSASWG